MLNQPVNAGELPSEVPARNPEWAVPVDAGLNLFQVSPTLYRSEALDKDDVAKLHALNIKTVLSLRAFHSDSSMLKGSGITKKRIKILTWRIRDKEVVAALRAIKAAEKNGAVLLHCLHGADRTGTIAAMYRMTAQDWSREAALNELQNGGYGYHSMWKNIIEYLENVDIDKIKQEVAA